MLAQPRVPQTVASMVAITTSNQSSTLESTVGTVQWCSIYICRQQPSPDNGAGTVIVNARPMTSPLTQTSCAGFSLPTIDITPLPCLPVNVRSDGFDNHTPVVISTHRKAPPWPYWYQSAPRSMVYNITTTDNLFIGDTPIIYRKDDHCHRHPTPSHAPNLPLVDDHALDDGQAEIPTRPEETYPRNYNNLPLLGRDGKKEGRAKYHSCPIKSIVNLMVLILLSRLQAYAGLTLPSHSMSTTHCPSNGFSSLNVRLKLSTTSSTADSCRSSAFEKFRWKS